MSIKLTLDTSFNIFATNQFGGVASSADGQYMYRVVNGNGFYKSVDSGLNWNFVDCSLNNGELYSVACSSSGAIVYVSRFLYGVYKSTDYGQTFPSVANFSTVYTNPPGYLQAVAGTVGGQFINQVACDSTGSIVIVSLRDGNPYVYISTTSGEGPNSSWTPSFIDTSNTLVSYIACNSDASILYAIAGVDPNSTGVNSNVYQSTNGGSSWSMLPSSTGNWAGLTCDSAGQKVYASSLTPPYVGLQIFYPANSLPQLITSPDTSYFGQVSSYSNGNGLLVSSETLEIINTYTVKYPPPIICFKEDSKILCLVDDVEVYVPIQYIRKGALVKTYSSGYVPVNMIGTSKIYNEANALRSKYRLYKCSTEKYPELTEDLVITGCHSILAGHLTDEQREKTKEIVEKIFVTDNHYRLLAMLDERAEPFQEEGVFSIWHLALDHEDERMNYGVYANGGLLVETTSRRMLSMYSGMTLLE